MHTLKRPVTWLAIVLFIACALIRGALLKRHGLWADELFSVAIATGHSLEHPATEADPKQGDYVEQSGATSSDDYRKYLQHDSPPASPARVIRAVYKSDTSPPLYYVLLSFWTRILGTGDSAVRLFTVAAALACFPLIWWLGKKIGGTATAVAACALYTFSPTSVYYGTEARMYSLLWFFTLATMATTLQMWRRGSNASTLILWVLSAAAGLLTHYFIAFVLAALGLWLIIFPGRASRARIVLGAVAIGLLVAPWYVQVPSTLKHWRVTDYWLNITPDHFNRFYSIVCLPLTYLTVNGFWWEWSTLDWINTIVLVLIAILSIVVLNRRLFTPKRAMLWLCMLSACAGLVVFDAWRKTYVVDYPRYALAGFPAALLLVAFAAARLPKFPRYVLVPLLALVWLRGDLRIYRMPQRLHPLQQVAQAINANATADDLVIVSSIPSGVSGIARYMERAPGNEPKFASWVEQLKGRHVPEDLMTLADGRKRIILVRIHEVWAEPQHEDWLLHNASLKNKIALKHSTIEFFEPREGERFQSFARAATTRPGASAASASDHLMSR